MSLPASDSLRLVQKMEPKASECGGMTPPLTRSFEPVTPEGGAALRWAPRSKKLRAHNRFIIQ
jgi:hypothetical protein